MKQVGGYTQYGANIVTPFQGFQNYINSKNLKTKVVQADGCFVMNNSQVLLNQAIQAAKASDLVFIFVGDNQDTCQESWGGRTGDRASLVLFQDNINIGKCIFCFYN